MFAAYTNELKNVLKSHFCSTRNIILGTIWLEAIGAVAYTYSENAIEHAPGKRRASGRQIPNSLTSTLENSYREIPAFIINDIAQNLA